MEKKSKMYTQASSLIDACGVFCKRMESQWTHPLFIPTEPQKYLFDSLDLPQPKKEDSTTQYTAMHILLSVSVYSNVTDFEEPVCFISDGNSQDLVNKMVDHLGDISDHAYRLLREEFTDVFEQQSQK